jgi:hypothetical protein
MDDHWSSGPTQEGIENARTPPTSGRPVRARPGGPTICVSLKASIEDRRLQRGP